MISEIREAIYSLTLTAASLNANNTFWQEAPQNTSEDPYCTLSLVSNLISRDTDTDFEEITFQANIHGTSLSVLETIEDELFTIWKNPLVAFNALISANIATQIIPLFRELNKFDEKYWTNTIRFRILIKNV